MCSEGLNDAENEGIWHSCRQLPLPAAVDVIDSVTRGRILFIEQGCVSCHQEKKSKPVGLGRWEGNFNWYDETNRPIQHSRDLTAGVFRAGAAGSDVFRIISGGSNVGPMPNYLKRRGLCPSTTSRKTCGRHYWSSMTSCVRYPANTWLPEEPSHITESRCILYPVRADSRT